jgi:hypothetical protein
MEQMLLSAQAQMSAMEGQQPVASAPWAMMPQQPTFQQPAAPSTSPGMPFNIANLAGMNGMDPNQFNGMAVPQGMPANPTLAQQARQQNPPQNQGGEQPQQQQQQQQPQNAPIDNNLLANWMNLQAAMGGNPAMMAPFMNMNPAASGMNPGMMPFAFPGFMNQTQGQGAVNNPLANMGASPNLNQGGSNV